MLMVQVTAHIGSLMTMKPSDWMPLRMYLPSQHLLLPVNSIATFAKNLRYPADTTSSF